MLLEITLIFILGLCIGSFLNVLVDRINLGEGFIRGKSHCDSCKKDLAWHDNIPLLSFVFLGGKCRYCKSKLSFYYPVSELTTGILFVGTSLFVYQNFGFNVAYLFYYLFMTSAFIAVFFSDLKYGIIPDKVTYPAIVASLIFDLQFPMAGYLFSAIGAFIFFLILALVTKGKGMGIGDLKLAILIGLFLGFPKTVMALYLAFLTGAVIGVILILWRKKKLRGSTIPFGPFLVLGTILALFFLDPLNRLLFAKIF